MQSLSVTTAAAAMVQIPSVSELHMVKAKHSKKEQLQKTEVKVCTSPATAVRQCHLT